MTSYAIILREQDGSSVYNRLESDMTLEEVKDKAAAWCQDIDHGSIVEIVEVFDAREVQICSMTLHSGRQQWECIDLAGEKNASTVASRPAAHR
jgi:hypothetical protein